MLLKNPEENTFATTFQTERIVFDANDLNGHFLCASYTDEYTS